MPEDESADNPRLAKSLRRGEFVAGRDINITTGVDPGVHAGFISENDRMKRAFARLGLDPDADDFDAAIDRALEKATIERGKRQAIRPRGLA